MTIKNLYIYSYISVVICSQACRMLSRLPDILGWPMPLEQSFNIFPLFALVDGKFWVIIAVGARLFDRRKFEWEVFELLDRWSEGWRSLYHWAVGGLGGLAVWVVRAVGRTQLVQELVLQDDLHSLGLWNDRWKLRGAYNLWQRLDCSDFLAQAARLARGLHDCWLAVHVRRVCGEASDLLAVPGRTLDGDRLFSVRLIQELLFRRISESLHVLRIREHEHFALNAWNIGEGFFGGVRFRKIWEGIVFWRYSKHACVMVIVWRNRSVGALHSELHKN